MTSNLQDRINLIIEAKRLTRTGFANKIGVASSNFSKMLNGEQTITEKTLVKIIEAFPDVSLQWLKTGEGEMLNSKAAEEAPAPPVEKKIEAADVGLDNISVRLMALVESQQQTIANHAATIAQLTENNNRLVRLLEGYKKATAPEQAAGVLSSAVLP